MHISSLEEYGTRCALQLAKRFDQGPVPAKEIADEEKISLEYARKIMFLFKKSGLISAERGTNGGFYLNFPPEDITLKMVFDALGEYTQKYSNFCERYVEKNDQCVHSDGCSVRPVLGLISTYFSDFLNAISLNDLMLPEDKVYALIIDR